MTDARFTSLIAHCVHTYPCALSCQLLLHRHLVLPILATISFPIASSTLSYLSDESVHNRMKWVRDRIFSLLQAPSDGGHRDLTFSFFLLGEEGFLSCPWKRQ